MHACTCGRHPRIVRPVSPGKLSFSYSRLLQPLRSMTTYPFDFVVDDKRWGLARFTPYQRSGVVTGGARWRGRRRTAGGFLPAQVQSLRSSILMLVCAPFGYGHAGCSRARSHEAAQVGGEKIALCCVLRGFQRASHCV